jgi:hypothetical protein
MSPSISILQHLSFQPDENPMNAADLSFDAPGLLGRLRNSLPMNSTVSTSA